MRTTPISPSVPAARSTPRRSGALQCLLAASLAACAISATAQGRLPQAEAAGLIVKFRDGSGDAAAIDARMQGLRAHAVGRGLAVRGERATATGARVLHLDRRMPAADLQAIAAELQRYDSSIEFVQPNYVLRPAWVPNDTHFADQWSLLDGRTGSIRAESAWNLTRGFGVRVAVLDTGIRPHADLAANLLPGRDFVTDQSRAGDSDGRDSDPADPGDWASAGDCGTGKPATSSSWHGTHVAGIIAARGNNGLGVSGVAPRAQLVPIRVLGRCGGTTADMIDGALWAAGLPVTGLPNNLYPARVLNLSITSAHACSAYEQQAIDRIVAQGVLVVVSAGNDEVDVSQVAPASCKGVITVGATNLTGSRSFYSNTGAGVHLSAPGGDSDAGILSTANSGMRQPVGDNYTQKVGTSMAAPHVAATAALMLSVNPQLPSVHVKRMMEETATPLGDNCTVCGKGILNADLAVQAARGWRVEREPNGTLASAEPLVHDLQEIEGVIQATSSTDDEDLFLLALPARRSLAVHLLNRSGNFDLDLDLISQTGQVIRTAKAGGPGKDEKMTHYNTGFEQTEYWTIKVRRGAGSTRTTAAKAYTLKLQRGPLPY